jgi:hypothetical protein
MQDLFWTWLLALGNGALLSGILAFLIWFLAVYSEAVIYNFHRPDAIVPQNRRQAFLLRLYDKHPRSLNALLDVFYVGSYVMFILTGFFISGASGAATSCVLGIFVLFQFRNGLSLKDRVEKKRKHDESLRKGELKLFG